MTARPAFRTSCATDRRQPDGPRGRALARAGAELILPALLDGPSRTLAGPRNEYAEQMAGRYQLSHRVGDWHVVTLLTLT